MAKKRRESNIPYALRLQEKKLKEIGDHREDASNTALCIALVLMNDELGVGYKRLVKYTRKLNTAIREYYEDPEVEYAHLMHRLRQIGFDVENGKLTATIDPETGEPIRKEKLKNG